MNLAAYINAGYVPIYYCLEPVAREHVSMAVRRMPVKLQGEAYLVNIGGEDVGEMWVESGWFYDEGTLFKRRS